MCIVVVVGSLQYNTGDTNEGNRKGGNASRCTSVVCEEVVNINEINKGRMRKCN